MTLDDLNARAQALDAGLAITAGRAALTAVPGAGLKVDAASVAVRLIIPTALVLVVVAGRHDEESGTQQRHITIHTQRRPPFHLVKGHRDVWAVIGLLSKKKLSSSIEMRGAPRSIEGAAAAGGRLSREG